jgi:hypothetical protein
MYKIVLMDVVIARIPIIGIKQLDNVFPVYAEHPLHVNKVIVPAVKDT